MRNGDFSIGGQAARRCRLAFEEGIHGDDQWRYRNDKLSGFPVDDIINGLGGNDQLTDDFGNDKLDGGAGNDILIGNSETTRSSVAPAMTNCSAASTRIR